MVEFNIEKTVLVVDDEPALRSAVCEYLISEGYDAVESPSGTDAIGKIVQVDFNAVITDIRMPEMSGLDLIHVLGKLCEDTIIILLTAVPDPDANLAALAKEAGVFAYLNKPCKLKIIKETLERAFAEKEASKCEHQTEEGQGHQEAEVNSEQEQSQTIEDATEHVSDSDIAATMQDTTLPTEPRFGGDSYFLAEIEAIISDTNQIPLQDEDKVDLSIELYSHRFGDLHLNSKRSIKEEIEDVLLNPKVDIRQLSPREYVDLSREGFHKRGWVNWPVSAGKDGEQIALVDFYKDGIGLKFGIQSPAIRMDMFNLQKACCSDDVKIDMCVFIIQTGNSQKYLKRKTGKAWSGAAYGEAVRILKSVQRQIDVPICILGLDVSGSVDKYEIELASYARNVAPVPAGEGSADTELILGEMSAIQIKECVFNFLEKKYSRLIDRNVRVKGKGKVLGLDGLMRLSTDVILEIEMSRSQGSSNLKSLSCIGDDLASQLVDYGKITGRRAVMRFILLGEFPPGFLRDLTWRIESLRENDGVWIDYEVMTFENIGIRVHDGLKRIYMEE